MDTHPNELALINACLRHEPQPFHELFIRFHRAVHAGACRAIAHRLGVCGTADDLTAQFFLRVVESPEKMLHGSAGRKNLTPWLTAVAFRQCSVILRSDAWRWPGPGPIALTQELDRLPAADSHRAKNVNIVRRAVDLLDEHSRAIIRMRFGLGTCVQPRSIREIAVRLGCDRRTVNRQLHNAIRQLRVQVCAIRDDLDE